MLKVCPVAAPVPFAQVIANHRAMMQRFNAPMTVTNLTRLAQQYEGTAKCARKKLRAGVATKRGRVDYCLMRRGGLQSARAFYTLAREASR